MMPDLLPLAVPVLAAAVASGTGILLATLGEILAQRAGVLNLGVEGMMLTGALAGFAIAHATGSHGAGFAAAGAAGALLALVHALLTVGLRASQVVSGLALTILGTGLSGFFGRTLTGRPLPTLPDLPVPLLADLPVAGPVLFRHDPAVYGSWLAVAAVWVLLGRTRLGLHLRAVGEDPHAAGAAGIGVARIRCLAVVLGGGLAGLGGAYLSQVHTGMWVQNVTAGQGWIALALVVFALWHPGRAVAGAYLFGGITALQLRLQAAGTMVPVHFLLMLPYLATIAILALVSSRDRRRGSLHAPAALGLPFDPEERSLR
jgi:simple sugar transport system permease protein